MRCGCASIAPIAQTLMRWMQALSSRPPRTCMSAPIRLLESGWNVLALRKALARHPELWDQHRERTAPEDSPHHGLSDIWVRFADPATMREDGSHDSIWYPPAAVLPVEPITRAMLAMTHGTRLGG